jgi:type IV pilus assembly protein PilQ
MKIANTQNSSRTWMVAGRRAGASLSLWLALALPAWAANTLQDVSYAAAPGGKVDITLKFDQPVGAVQAFTTDTPPRIAIDLPETKNALAQRRVAIGSGATSAVSATESAGKTRVVVDLFRPAAYTTRSNGNSLIITVDAGAVASSNATAMNPNDPTKRVSTLSVSNVDFRRGENGAGRVVLKFSGDGAAADMRNEGGKVVVDISNAQIPENLRKRLDVTDFATPVTSIEPRNNAGATRLVINTAGGVESMAYQTGNEYIVEIAPKRGTVVANNDRNLAGPGAIGAVRASNANQRYTGRPVTFNFQDVPVRTVLQLIAEETNINIVSSDTVAGNLTLRLVNVPWDQALDIILRAKNLDKRREGNVIWVGPQEEIAKYEQAKEDARIALENRAETVSEFIQVNYHSAKAIFEALTKDQQQSGGGGGGGAGAEQNRNAFLSPRGRLVADERTNTLLIQDIPKKVAEMKQLISVIDRPVDQVLIEARIVVATESFSRDLGARFRVEDVGGSTSSGIINSVFSGPSDAATVGLSILNPQIQLNVELDLLEKQGKGEVISNPRVITTNQRESVIRQGDEVGYSTAQGAGSGATQTVQFKEALLEMRVTPTITQDDRIGLSIGVKKDELISFFETDGGNRIPQFTKREVNTAVLIDNGQTVVIGGVYEFRNTNDVSKVPFLGDVPFLGNLFKSKSRSKEKAELLIFITPRIIKVAKR